MELADFNTLDAKTAHALVGVWAAVPRWVDGVVAARPYPSVTALEARAADLARGWGEPELEQALTQHPRIGERREGADAEAAASRREQAAMADAEPGVTAAIAALNVEYEKRFGRVFLIRAAGRSPAQMLAELQRRLDNDPDAEVREACAQLAEIALLRLRGAVSETAGGDTAASGPPTAASDPTSSADAGRMPT